MVNPAWKGEPIPAEMAYRPNAAPQVPDTARSGEQPIPSSPADAARELKRLQSLVVRWANLNYPQKEIWAEAKRIEKKRASKAATSTRAPTE